MEQDRAKGGRLGWVSDYAKGLVALAGRIGLDPTDSHETALQKRLVVVLCAGTLPLTVLWSAIYLAVGVPLAAAIPGFYSIITPINTAIFAWTRNLGFYRFTQLLTILILPWLLMMCLGELGESSVVIIWAALCPLGSLLLEDLRQTLFWIVGFVSADRKRPPAAVSRAGRPARGLRDLVLRAQCGHGDRDHLRAPLLLCRPAEFLSASLRNAAAQHTPEGNLEALKADQPATAAHYDAASILFADVVEFTPMAAKMTPLQLVDLLNEVFQCFDGLVEKYRPGEDQDDRRLLHGRIRRAAITSGPRQRDRRLGARLAGCRHPAPVRRPPALAPHRHQLRPSGGQRHRPQNSFMTCGAKP